MNILGRTTFALVDTGSTSSFINKKLLEELKVMNLPVYKIPEENLVVGNGNVEIINTVIGLPLQVESFGTRLGVRCLPSLPEEMILGLDFLKQSGMIISTEDNAFLFNDNPDNVYKIL